MTANMVVLVERGSVHASDDAPCKQISVSLDTTLQALVALAIADRYLPGIAGGQATWVVESSGAGAGAAMRPIAVWAQQWAQVKFLVDSEILAAVHFDSGMMRLNLRYHCQDDPAAVLVALEAARV